MREFCLAMDAGDTRDLIGLTVDDGYEDFLSDALPTLERLGFCATVFVVAGKLGKENDWEHRGAPRPRSRLLGAEGVREVSERGMEVGSHSMTHPRLSRLDPETLVHEVRASRRALSEVVGTPVEGFCYPYGDLNGRAVQAARRAGYVYAGESGRCLPSLSDSDNVRVILGLLRLTSRNLLKREAFSPAYWKQK